MTTTKPATAATLKTPPVPRGMRFCPVCGQCRPQSEFYLSPFCTGELFPICERHLSEKEADARVERARQMLARAGVRPRSPLCVRPEPSPHRDRVRPPERGPADFAP